jgi:hypothetical protein
VKAVAISIGTRVGIELPAQPSPTLRLAASELARGLYHLGFTHSAVGTQGNLGHGDLTFALRSDGKTGERYSIRIFEPNRLLIHAVSDQAVVYGVMDWLERQGAVFGLDGEYYPLHRQPLRLPQVGEVWEGKPIFATRGMLPWPDFLNCVTTHNQADWRAYLEAMLRSRLNAVGIHIYSQSEKWVEAFMGFEFAGVGHNAFLDTTATDRWGYLPQRTSTYGMGAAQFFDGEVFGADSARRARDPWEAVELASAELRRAFAYAKTLGIQTGIGFEPLQLPEEIVRACPPHLQRKVVIEHPRVDGAIRRRQFEQLDPHSRAAKAITETRLAKMLETYPEVDHVYIWEEEYTHWASRIMPIDPEPLLRHVQYTYAFLQHHAPGKRLILGGWGGFVRNFEHYHRALPEDIIFAAHSDQFGQDHIHEAFGKLESRERWPIPWVEDDPNMWFPQLHVGRFEQDLRSAAAMGAQGLMGNHWRHRTADPVASYMARAAWDNALTLERHYADFAQAHSANHAPEVAEWFARTDRERLILCTATDRIGPDGHVVVKEYSPDFNEGFRVDWKYEVEEEFAQAQHAHVEALGDLMRSATDALERERLAYWYHQTSFVDHYARAWQQGKKLHAIVQEAIGLQAAQLEGEATRLALEQGVPVWLELLRHTRRAMQTFHKAALTRQDLGTLASLHNKFVRIAAHRFRLALIEFADLPLEAEQAYAECLADDPAQEPALIVPTRPTRLAGGERVEFQAIVPGHQAPGEVVLRWRVLGKSNWHDLAMPCLGRRTYRTELAMPEGAAGLELQILARVGNQTLHFPAAGFHLVSSS